MPEFGAIANMEGGDAREKKNGNREVPVLSFSCRRVAVMKKSDGTVPSGFRRGTGGTKILFFNP